MAGEIIDLFPRPWKTTWWRRAFTRWRPPLLVLGAALGVLAMLAVLALAAFSVWR